MFEIESANICGSNMYHDKYFAKNTPTGAGLPNLECSVLIQCYTRVVLAENNMGVKRDERPVKWE